MSSMILHPLNHTPFCEGRFTTGLPRAKKPPLNLFKGSIVIFVSAPYTSPDISTTEMRVQSVYKYIAFLAKQNQNATSPIILHPIAKTNGLPTTFEFWNDYCFDLLKRCDSIHVLTLEGWKESTGVKAEIEFAKQNQIPVFFKTID